MSQQGDNGVALIILLMQKSLNSERTLISECILTVSILFFSALLENNVQNGTVLSAIFPVQCPDKLG